MTRAGRAEGWAADRPSADRRAFGRFVNGVSVVAVRRGDRFAALAAEWCTPLSISPALIGVYVGRTRHTLFVLRGAERFGVSLLADDQAAIAHELGDRTGWDGPKGAGAYWRQGPVLSVPLVAGAQATFECNLVSTAPYGDHLLVVGDPVAASADGPRRPLAYSGGRYFALGAQIERP